MDPYFFRVEHDLLKSEAFKQLNGSAIKVYLVLGLFSDFGTGWAYPSIRTIAKQAGVSRQTVLNAIDDLVNLGLVAISKSRGRSTAYRILHNTPVRPSSKEKQSNANRSNIFSEHDQTVPISLDISSQSVLKTRTPSLETGLISDKEEAQFWADSGLETGPKQDNKNNNQTNDNVPSVTIPGTPFRVSVHGVLSSLIPIKEALVRSQVTNETANQISAKYAEVDVIKVILNAIYLQKAGKLQNAPGYIRTGVERNYELLPQVASKIELRRRKLESDLQEKSEKERKRLEQEQLAAEEASINLIIESLSRDDLEKLIRKAMKSLPEILVKRNPSISNPIIRARVFEMVNRRTDEN